MKNSYFSDKLDRKESYTLWILATVLLILIACVIILSSVPPVSRDALTHHLFVPKLWLQNGSIAPIPEIPFSYYPMNLDLLYMIPLWLGNDIIPKYIHFFFGLLTALLIYQYLKKRLSRNYALLGAIFFLSIPIIVKLSITVYVDLGLMFFTTASLLLLIKWMNSNYQARFLIASGLFCGLATGTKYNGLVTLFLLTLFVPILYLRSTDIKKSNIKSLYYGTVFLLCALISFSPWVLRNYSLTGNPIFPLHNSLFQQQLNEKQTIINSNITVEEKDSKNIIQKFTSRGSGIFATRKIIYDETWWQTLLLPIRFFFEGQDDTPKFFDGKLSPFLLILPFFAFVKPSSTNDLRREKYFLLSFAILFFFFTFFQQVMRIRYVVSIVSPLTILSIFGLHNIITVISKKFKKPAFSFYVAVLISTSLLIYNAVYIFNLFDRVTPFSYLTGNTSRDTYIQHHRSEYATLQYTNKRLEGTDKVLCLFLGGRGYYMDFEPIFEMPYKGGLLSSLLKQNKSGSILKKELLDRNIRYLLVRIDLVQNWINHLPSTQAQNCLDFLRSSKIIYKKSGYALFQLLD